MPPPILLGAHCSPCPSSRCCPSSWHSSSARNSSSEEWPPPAASSSTQWPHAVAPDPPFPSHSLNSFIPERIHIHAYSSTRRANRGLRGRVHRPRAHPHRLRFLLGLR